MVKLISKKYVQLILQAPKFFAGERDRLVLWVPVIFSAGIALYFLLPSEFPVYLPPAIASFIFLLIITFHAGLFRDYRYLFLVLFLFTAGFAGASLRTFFVKAPVLSETLPPTYIHGTVQDIEPLASGSRLILSEVDIWQYPMEKTPKKIRLNVKTDLNGAEPGDRIGVRAVLSPPARPVYPGAYDFSRYAYFSGIGAIGFSVSDVKIREKKNYKDSPVNRLRYRIAQRIITALPGDAGQMAVALLIGDQNGISKKTISNMRTSGLYHLLSISGLHMAIVMATSFFLLRALLALFPSVALRYNIKKWAAIFSLATGFGYLMISGIPVPAVRSYVMAALFFMAIIFDRTGTVMRPVALAAMVILITQPEALLSPSFQMSFAAVIALIASFEAIPTLRHDVTTEHGWFKKILIYFFAVTMSSLVAGVATSPFIIHHFNNYQQYGLLSNMIAVPVTSFLIMPAGMLALALMPFGAENLGLIPASWGINLIMSVAAKVSALPYSSINIVAMPDWAFIMTVAGGLWLCLWKSRVRLLGIAPFLLGMCAIFLHSTPDIIVDGKGKLFALKGQDDKLYFSSRVSARFARETWMKINGQQQAPLIKNSSQPEISCDEQKCRYHSKHWQAVIIPSGSTESSCPQTDILINLANNFACSGRNVTITAKDLLRKGTHALWLSDDIVVKTVADRLGNRPWTSGDVIAQAKDEDF